MLLPFAQQRCLQHILHRHARTKHPGLLSHQGPRHLPALRQLPRVGPVRPQPRIAVGRGPVQQTLPQLLAPARQALRVLHRPAGRHRVRHLYQPLPRRLQRLSRRIRLLHQPRLHRRRPRPHVPMVRRVRFMRLPLRAGVLPHTRLGLGARQAAQPLPADVPRRGRVRRQQLTQRLHIGPAAAVQRVAQHPLGAKVVPCRVKQHLPALHHLGGQCIGPPLFGRAWRPAQPQARQHPRHLLHIGLGIAAIGPQRVQL